MTRTEELMIAASQLRGPLDAGLHHLWCEAKEQCDYNKQWWQARQHELEQAYYCQRPGPSGSNDRLNCAMHPDIASKCVRAFLSRIHGSIPCPTGTSAGAPESSWIPQPDLLDAASALHTRLMKAIEHEDYESAACLRDLIHRLTSPMADDSPNTSSGMD